MKSTLTKALSQFDVKKTEKGFWPAIKWLMVKGVRSLYWKQRLPALVFLAPFHWILYFVSGFFPRDNRLWLFGTYGEGFDHNSKYLFLHASTHLPEVRACWISSDEGTLALIKSMGLQSASRWSARGIWLCMRAKYYFFNWYVSDINFYTSSGATQINLWHGTPLKRIGYDVTVGQLAQMYHNPRWRDRFLYAPQWYVMPQFLVSASRYVSEYSLSTAFRVPLERCLELGYPRLDVLFWEKNSIRSMLQQTADTECLKLLERLGSFKRIILIAHFQG